MRRRAAAVSVTLAALAATHAAHAALVAFPGAEGAGANAVGGRFGTVYHVTNLNDSSAGSLRDAVSQPNRTIVFDVGGVITLNSKLNISQANLTLAGQTAPGPGIILRGKSTYISGNDTVVRYLRSRVGKPAGSVTNDEEDGISVTGGNKVIVDHSSAAWSNDEVMSLTNSANNVTLQYNYITEALNHDGHSYGSLIRPQITASYSLHHNLYAHNWSRNPRPGTYNGQTVNLDFRNNVIYNWGDQAGYSGNVSPGEFVNMNYVGNYLVAGPDTGSTRTTRAFDGASTNTVIYQSDNRIDSDRDAALDGTNTGWGMFVGSYTQQATPFPAAAVATDSPDLAYQKILASAGAFPWARDTVDARITGDVLTQNTVDRVPGSSATQIILDETNVGGYPAVTSVARPAGWDSDNDGMPNWWETARGLNPSVAGPTQTTLTGPGTYTDLEHYLNYLTLFAHWNANANGNFSSILNWRGTLPDATDATAVFGSAITAPRTITVDSPRTVGQLYFDSAHAYTLAGTNPITIDVIAGMAFVDVVSGSHAISAPLALADSTTFTVTPAGGTLTVNNLQPTAAAVTKGGAGTLAVNQIRSGALAINAGTLKVLPNGTASGVSTVAALSIAAGAKLDLSDNALITSSPTGTWNGAAYTGVAGLIDSGRGENGLWDGGGGIVTSDTRATAAGDLTTIGVATAAQITGIAPTATTTFAGQTVLGSDTVAMFTWGGDANLDGKINIDDYGRIDGNVSIAGASGWFNGDFNYDGKINIDDYGIIDGNVGSQSAPFFSSIAVTQRVTEASAVPEPKAFSAVVAFASLTLLAHRRRT